MQEKECDCPPLSRVLGRLVNKLTENRTDEGGKEWTRTQQFGFLWLGAFVFAYPLFMMHLSESLRAGFSGIVHEEIVLMIAGAGSSAVFAALPAWLAMTEHGKRTKLRLFLTGFLLPYGIMALLLPLMQTN